MKTLCDFRQIWLQKIFRKFLFRCIGWFSLKLLEVLSIFGVTIFQIKRKSKFGKIDRAPFKCSPSWNIEMDNHVGYEIHKEIFVCNMMQRINIINHFSSSRQIVFGQLDIVGVPCVSFICFCMSDSEPNGLIRRHQSNGGRCLVVAHDICTNYWKNWFLLTCLDN